jgi:DNA-binding NarL/FixJ family response regulator
LTQPAPQKIHEQGENQPQAQNEGLEREKALVSIAGNNSLQNELLKTFLENQVDVLCRVMPGNGTSDLIRKATDRDSELVLFDCYALQPNDIWRKLELGNAIQPAETATALFNIVFQEDVRFERRAIEKQIRGVFYRHEPPQRLAKGVEKILMGELWYSRKTTSQILLDSQSRMARTEAAQAMLTPREKEILISIASGASNTEIAEAFFISPHTVKTHLYNIYKKIDVNNRLEATLWVARYI